MTSVNLARKVFFAIFSKFPTLDQFFFLIFKANCFFIQSIEFSFAFDLKKSIGLGF